MSQSISKLQVQIIFHFKNSSITIGREIENELYAYPYIASIVKDNNSISMIKLASSNYGEIPHFVRNDSQ